MNCPHTHFSRGKRVIVRTKDGGTFVDKFVTRTSRFVRFNNNGIVDTRDIKSITIYNNKADRNGS